MRSANAFNTYGANGPLKIMQIACLEAARNSANLPKSLKYTEAATVSSIYGCQYIRSRQTTKICGKPRRQPIELKAFGNTLVTSRAQDGRGTRTLVTSTATDTSASSRAQSGGKTANSETLNIEGARREGNTKVATLW